MLIFLAIATLMTATALAFILVPLMRKGRGVSDDDSAAGRLRALDKALTAGAIDVGKYAAKSASTAPTSSANPTHRLSCAMIIAMMLAALTLPTSAFVLYQIVGTPQALDPTNLVAASSPHHGQALDMEQLIARLAARLADQPDDLNGWLLLGRASQQMGSRDQSLNAFRRAHELAKGDPAVTVEYAEALAFVAPSHRIGGESRALLEEAVKQDAHNQRALWLLGVSDYEDGKYNAAIVRWNALLPLLDENSEDAANVKKQIADAQALLEGKAP